MNYQQGDIVLIDFPFSDGSGSKVRPVIIISNKSLRGTQEIFFLPITGTNFNDNFGFEINDYSLLVPLPKPSYIRVNKILALDKRLIIRKINQLKHPFLIQLVEKLISLIQV